MRFLRIMMTIMHANFGGALEVQVELLPKDLSKHLPFLQEHIRATTIEENSLNADLS